MSKAAVEWADAQMIEDPVMTAVLLRLAYMHHAKHPLFPSQSTLASLTKFSPRAVWEALKLLEKAGVIERRSRSRGSDGRTSDAFLLPVDQAPMKLTKHVIHSMRLILRNSHRERSGAGVSQLAPGARGSRTGSEGIVTEQSPIQEEDTQGVVIGTRAGTGEPRLRLVRGGKP